MANCSLIVLAMAIFCRKVEPAVVAAVVAAVVVVVVVVVIAVVVVVVLLLFLQKSGNLATTAQKQ